MTYPPLPPFQLYNIVQCCASVVQCSSLNVVQCCRHLHRVFSSSTKSTPLHHAERMHRRRWNGASSLNSSHASTVPHFLVLIHSPSCRLCYPYSGVIERHVLDFVLYGFMYILFLTNWHLLRDGDNVCNSEVFLESSPISLPPIGLSQRLTRKESRQHLLNSLKLP